MSEKESYIAVGKIVAFRDNAGRTKSAKIKRVSTSNKMVEVETAYGQKHLVCFENILWVKTNGRWPRGIFAEFKNNAKKEC